MPKTWKETLEGLSKVSGVNFAEEFEKGRARGSTPDASPHETREQLEHEQAAARASLPNRKAKARFDKLQARKPYNREKLAKKREKKDAAHLQKLKRKLESSGFSTAKPAEIPSHEWIKCSQIVADSTGQAAKYYADSESNKVAVGLFFQNFGGRAALAGDSPGAIRARRILALLLMLLSLANSTRRTWDRWNSLCKGIPILALQAALRDPYTSNKPARQTLCGTHCGKLERDDRGRITDVRTMGEVGYLRALKNARIIYSRQARWHGPGGPNTRGWENIGDNEIRPESTLNGWRVSLNRYWLVTDRWSDPYQDAEKALLYAATVTAEKRERVDVIGAEEEKAPEPSGVQVRAAPS